VSATDQRAQVVLMTLCMWPDDEPVTVRDVRHHTWDLSDAIIRRRLAQLEQAGLIERVGERPRRWWVVRPILVAPDRDDETPDV
jgi:hypothetical protein